MRAILFFLISILLAATVIGAEIPTDLREEGFIPMHDGARLYYTKQGTGPIHIVVPAALFVENPLKKLAAPDRTLIFYDMRNRGASDYVQNAASLTIQQDVEDLEQLRKHFKLDRMSLIGISYLGEMIILYAVKYPQHVDRMIQIGPVGLKFGTKYAPQYMAEDPMKVIDQKKYNELKQLKEKEYNVKYPRYYCEKQWLVYRDMFVGDPAKAEKIQGSPCQFPNEWPIHFDRHLNHHFESVQKLDVSRDEIRKLQHPVLTIHGTKDRNAAYGGGREWSYLLPEGRLLTLPGVAHFPTDEVPGLVLPAVDQFLKREWPAKAEKVTEDPVVQAGK